MQLGFSLSFPSQMSQAQFPFYEHLEFQKEASLERRPTDEQFLRGIDNLLRNLKDQGIAM